ncbi:unnamed protein product [Vitrella brassicaformis CCMP3155]|uniref:Uncharacterized protein n=1 Tax=Vitrella brassicaformis (strain CCMP3155) TaxID=1169540 RepID=A0A0G4EMA2_VITBC|nr:unnamed protein product [Vitrella brassicaformis CCMP3155]|eukprot:CEL97998.1 unnamed protein product [Vitrella brassicaformis CCMP3155]
MRHNRGKKRGGGGFLGIGEDNRCVEDLRCNFLTYDEPTPWWMTSKPPPANVDEAEAAGEEQDDQPQAAAPAKTKSALLHGRLLRGTAIKLADYGMRGIVGVAEEEERAGDGEIGEGAVQFSAVEGARVLKSVGEFDEFTYWNQDSWPRKKDDIQQCMIYTIMAKALHDTSADVAGMAGPAMSE